MNPFVHTNGPRDARIMLVGEAWGREEAAREEPFVGWSGQELNKMLSEVGIARNECLATNLVHAQPPGNKFYTYFHPNAEARAWGLSAVKGCYPDPLLMAGMIRLHELIERVRPDVIVTFGNYPTWALSADAFKIGKAAVEKGDSAPLAPTGITSWRGSQLRTERSYGVADHIRLVPSIHPAALARQWTHRVDIVHDLRARVLPCIRGAAWREPEYQFTIAPSAKETGEILDFLRDLPPSTPIARDCETYGGYISCIGLAWSPRHAICIPFRRADGSHYFNEEDELQIRLALRKLFASDKRWILHNAAYDLQYEHWEGLGCNIPWMDSMLIQHLLWPGRRKSLTYCSSLYNEFHSHWKDEAEWSDDEQKEVDPGTGDDTLWRYNCKDCCATLEVALELEKLIAHFNMHELMQERMDQLDLAMEATLSGLRINLEERKQQQVDILRMQMEHESFLRSLMPADIHPLLATKAAKAPWYNSPIQQMRFFYDLCCFPERIDRKRKTRTIDDDALRQIEQLEPLMRPMTRTLRSLRSLQTFYNNHLTAELSPADQRLRCTFKVAGPYTFRWASAEDAFHCGTNLQNIPADKGDRD